MNTQYSIDRKPFPHGIDITAPGGLSRLFDFNRSRFGNATMKAADAGTPAGGEGTGEGTTPDPKGTPDPSSNTDTALKEAGQRALAAERNRADEAERKLREREQAEMSELDRAKTQATDAEKRAEKLAADNLRLTAIADAEVAIPKKYHVLVRGTTEAELAESIAAVTELIKGAAATNPTPDPKKQQDRVGESGTGGGTGNNGAGGSMAAGADRYAARQAKK